MIDGLIAGKIYGHPKQGTGKNGSPYVTTKVRATASDGDTLMVSVIGFSDQVCQALLALGDGESVALTGSIVPKVWTDKEGVNRPALDMQAQAVLTAYQVNHRRKATAVDKSAGERGPELAGQ